MYKKIIIVLVILCIVELIAIGGLLIDRYTNQKEDVITENGANDNIDTELFPSESYQELCEYLYQLDVCMLQDERSSYSNFDKVKTVENYIERLNDAKEYYYDAINNSGNDSAVLELENFDHTWKDNISNKLNTYQSLLEQQYDTGTIVPLLLTKHKYFLYRSWVVDVFELWLAFQ